MGSFAGVKGIGAVVGPIIAASLRSKDHAKTAFGGYGFRNIEIFVGEFCLPFWENRFYLLLTDKITRRFYVNRHQYWGHYSRLLIIVE